MLERLLSDEKHSKNICIKHSAELELGDFFDRHELVNAGIVDEDVDLSEGLLRSRKQFFNIGFFATLAWTATALPPPLLI
jgi:hypothetical protein